MMRLCNRTLGIGTEEKGSKEPLFRRELLNVSFVTCAFASGKLNLFTRLPNTPAPPHLNYCSTRKRDLNPFFPLNIAA